MYKISKRIPMPKPRSDTMKYPFSKMFVGDSFKVKAKDADKARAAASQYGNRNNKKFISRKVGGDVRFWRVK